jgi:hypothetical protein
MLCVGLPMTTAERKPTSALGKSRHAGKDCLGRKAAGLFVRELNFEEHGRLIAHVVQRLCWQLFGLALNRGEVRQPRFRSTEWNDVYFHPNGEIARKFSFRGRGLMRLVITLTARGRPGVKWTAASSFLHLEAAAPDVDSCDATAGFLLRLAIFSVKKFAARRLTGETHDRFQLHTVLFEGQAIKI